MRRGLALVGLSLWWAAAAAGPDIPIELQEQVLVTTSVYTLADVARLDEVEPGLRQQLDEIDLGRTPRPGYLANVTRHEIAARIERLLPGTYSRIHWTGALVTRVQAGGVAFSGAELAVAAQRALQGHLDRRFARNTVQLLGAPRDITLPAGAVSVTADLREAQLPRKRTPVWVDIAVDGQHYRSVPVWFSVSAWDKVAASQRDLSRNHVIRAEDVQLVSVDVAGLGGEAATAIDELVGKRLTRPLTAGSVIEPTLVREVPPVMEGEVVSVAVASGRVSLQASGIALKDGEINQRIPVQNASSGERYYAVVIERGHVKVE